MHDLRQGNRGRRCLSTRMTRGWRYPLPKVPWLGVRLVLGSADFQPISSPTKKLHEAVLRNKIHSIILGSGMKFPLSFIVLRFHKDIAGCPPYIFFDLREAGLFNIETTMMRYPLPNNWRSILGKCHLPQILQKWTSLCNLMVCVCYITKSRNIRSLNLSMTQKNILRPVSMTEPNTSSLIPSQRIDLASTEKKPLGIPMRATTLVHGNGILSGDITPFITMKQKERPWSLIFHLNQGIGFWHSRPTALFSAQIA